MRRRYGVVRRGSGKAGTVLFRGVTECVKGQRDRALLFVLVGRADVREDEFGKRGGAMRHGGEDATPMGLGICLGGTQGRPAWRSPTLGSGTQSRWDWGAGELMGGVGGPRAVLWAGIRCPVGTRGVGEWGDEKAIGGGSPGQRQGRNGVVSGVTECVKGQRDRALRFGRWY